MSRAFAGTRVTSLPSITIEPAVPVSSPAISRSSVDFPQPDGPTSTTNSPSPIDKSISATAATGPNRFVKPVMSMVANMDLRHCRWPRINEYCAGHLILKTRVLSATIRYVSLSHQVSMSHDDLRIKFGADDCGDPKTIPALNAITGFGIPTS
jgi:hypothetical protein